MENILRFEPNEPAVCVFTVPKVEVKEKTEKGEGSTAQSIAPKPTTTLPIQITSRRATFICDLLKAGYTPLERSGKLMLQKKVDGEVLEIDAGDFDDLDGNRFLSAGESETLTVPYDDVTRNILIELGIKIEERKNGGTRDWGKTS